ncbi:hypothetical protein [Qipengyuania sp. MTN3-11]|uniref:hypothetical protein n=1 Tax=Qipengyuania sp. MTN3-11 TaxID=3056557 RepID=UPI0036F3370F
MRAAIVLMVFLAMAGCEREPSFDERYAEASTKITEKAQEMDRELGSPSPAPSRTGSGMPAESK